MWLIWCVNSCMLCVYFMVYILLHVSGSMYILWCMICCTFQGVCIFYGVYFVARFKEYAYFMVYDLLQVLCPLFKILFCKCRVLRYEKCFVGSITSYFIRIFLQLYRVLFVRSILLLVLCHILWGILYCK